MLVVKAAAISPVEQLARDIGSVKQAGLFILELVDTAASTAVAQRFPLAAIERTERLFPKRRGAVHSKSSLALLSERNQAG
jgi:hypothetical protein